MSNIRSLEQKHKKALDKVNRIQMKIDKKLNAQKFVLGSMLMSIAKEDSSRIPQILADIDKYVTSEVDINRMKTFKSDLVQIREDSLGQPVESTERFKETINNLRRQKIDTSVDGPIDDDIPF